MAALSHRPLAGFYFFYFAYIGAFAPFFSLYLDDVGLSPVEIGVVMALPAVTRIIAPHPLGLACRRQRPAHEAGARGVAGGAGVLARHLRLPRLPVDLRRRVCRGLLPQRRAAGHGGDHAHPPRRAHRRATATSACGARSATSSPWSGLATRSTFFRCAPCCGSCSSLLAGSLLLRAGWFPRRRPRPTPPTSSRSRRSSSGRKSIALIVACALMAVAHGPYYAFYSIHVVDHGYSKGADRLAVGAGRGLRDRDLPLDVAPVLGLLAAQYPDLELRPLRGEVSADRLGRGQPGAAAVRAGPARGELRHLPRRRDRRSCTSCSAAGTRRAARRSTAASPSASAARSASLASGYLWDRPARRSPFPRLRRARSPACCSSCGSCGKPGNDRQLTVYNSRFP